MDTIAVLIVEPVLMRQMHLIDILSHDIEFDVATAGIDFPPDDEAALILLYDVIVLDADRLPVKDVCMWATIHMLWPNAHVVALTEGADDAVLEFALNAGVVGLHRPDVDPINLCRAIRRASQGIVDFDPELIGRARQAILQLPEHTPVHCGDLTIDLQAHQMWRDEQVVHLTPLEFRVLLYLIHHPDRPICLAELLQAVWAVSPDRGGTPAQVHNCIKRIRRKIEPDVKHPHYLRSARGWGYWLQDPTLLQVDASHELSLIESPPSQAFPRHN